MNMFISWFPLLLILGLFALWVRLIVRANRRHLTREGRRFYPHLSEQERRRREEDEWLHNPNNNTDPASPYYDVDIHMTRDD